MNAQTRQALDHLVNAVNVSINYKDKLFLNVLVGKNIPSLNKLTTKNNKNKTIFAEDVTFDDVKFAFESNNLQKELEETEQKYIDSKTINGLYADDRFVEGFNLRGIDIVGEIYQAFDNFTGEVLALRDEVVKKSKVIDNAGKRIANDKKKVEECEQELATEVDAYELESLNEKKKKLEKKIAKDEKLLSNAEEFFADGVLVYIPSNLVFKVRDKRQVKSKDKDKNKAKPKHKREEFQFEALEPLLDLLSKSMICHALKSYTDEELQKAGLEGKTFNSAVELFDAYYELGKTSKPSGYGNVVVPMFVRRILALTCYILIYLGDFISAKSNRGHLTETTGISANIMEEIYRITSAYDYPMFTKKGKMFVYDKWSIYPERMFKEESYISPKSPIGYPGIKQGWLGYVINKLQEQVPYEKFLDAFGGSGVSVVQFPHKKDSKYYTNDFHYANVCYYKILKADNERFSDFLDCITDIINALKIVVKNYSGNKIINNLTAGLYNIYDYVSDVCVDVNKQNYIANELIKLDFESAIRTMIGKDDYFCKYDSEIIIASVFFAYATMTMSGAISKTINSSDDKVINKLIKNSREDIENSFVSMRKVYRDVDVARELGASAMDLMAIKEFNNKKTLVYLDSPYIETAGYNANQAQANPNKVTRILTVADYGKNFISNTFPMDVLLDAVDNFKGSYIFSCRLALPNLKKYFFTGREVSSEVSPLTYNNYLWFFKRWSQMHNIDNIYMYCLYDEDWNKGERRNPDNFYSNYTNDVIYYDSRAVNPASRQYSAAYPVSASAKATFLGNTWKPTDGKCNFTKEELYDYLKYIIFCGLNFEIFITNKKYDVPKFSEMYEQLGEDDYKVFAKDNKASKNKYKKESGEIKYDGKNTEMLIPEHGSFVRIPMSVICELIDGDVNIPKGKEDFTYKI